MPENNNSENETPLMHFMVGSKLELTQKRQSVDTSSERDFPRITRIPGIMGGKPCIRGMRVTVGMITGQLSVGTSIDELLRHFTYLEKEDILQAIGYAGATASSTEYDLAGSN